MFCVKEQKTSIKADSKSTAADSNKMHTEFWWENLRERNHLEHPGVDGRIIVNHKVVWETGTGLIWLRTSSGGEHS